MPTQPDASVAQALSSLVQSHGRTLASEPARVGALLRDIVGAKRLEISLLMGVAESGVAAEIARGGSVRDVEIQGFAARVENDLGFTTENAIWGVQSWAHALGATTSPPGLTLFTVPSRTEPISARGSKRILVVAAAAIVLVIALAGMTLALRGDNSDTAGPPPTDQPSAPPGADSPTPPSGAPSATDTCANLDGIQKRVPKGYRADVGGTCTLLPVNKPASLTASSSARWNGSSITLRWDPPPGGAKPTGYLLFRDDSGKVYRTIEQGRMFTDTDVAWGSSHRYWVRTLADKRRSGPAYKAVSVGYPPLTDAHLSGTMRGSATVTYKSPNLNASGSWSHSVTFTFSCSSTGPCQSVAWNASDTGIPGCTSCSFTTRGTLRLSGSTYVGTYTGFGGVYCGNHRDTATISLALQVTNAAPVNGVWTATRASGTMKVYDPPQADCKAAARLTFAISVSR